jgi:hypothetical protein
VLLEGVEGGCFVAPLKDGRRMTAELVCVIFCLDPFDSFFVCTPSTGFLALFPTKNGIEKHIVVKNEHIEQNAVRDADMPKHTVPV